MTDTVIEEIHQTRRATSERFHGDIEAIAADAAARQSASGRPVWRAKAPNKRATSDLGLAGHRSRSGQQAHGGGR
jgi:hypothetical protein